MNPTRRLLAVLAAVLGLAATALAGAAGAKPSSESASPLTIFAAVSLTDVFPAIDAKQIYNFGGSNALAFQIRNGAPADVFASANTEIPAQLFKDGLVLQPVNFTRNKLVVVVPNENPAGITNVYDLTKPGVKVDIAAPSVPVGAYTLQVLKQMGLTARVLTNVVSQDEDVRSVLTRVALGQADAGFVYATDARTVPEDVKVIKVPAWAQPKVVYAMAVVTKSPNRATAQAYVKKILSKSGQATLAKFGFLALPTPTAGKPALRYQLTVSR
ncbi:MAG TPA: molybdate ABC transporter substrate-binding protein [Gaiellaceae bacterium]|jgi:molybdate transport system substrate-binding protein